VALRRKEEKEIQRNVRLANERNKERRKTTIKEGGRIN